MTEVERAENTVPDMVIEQPETELDDGVRVEGSAEGEPEEAVVPPAGGMSELDALAFRLADEFAELQAEVPDVVTADQIPDPVLDMAAAGLPLLDAYLRFRYMEERRVREEQERSRQAAGRSTGSLFGAAGQPQPEQEAFAKAFRSALW